MGKVLITGNLGYVGSELTKYLNQKGYDDLVGYDIGYFSTQITASIFGSSVTKQVYSDIRKINDKHFAISNDPMGKFVEDVTYDINFKGTINLAKMAKQNGVKKFIFASSCSVYGVDNEDEKKETSKTNPLTAYSKSKLMCEEELYKLADSNFQITCLRFSTACGMSDRLRLDLVVNDFVAAGVLNKKIVLLSSGEQWRPLIDVHDMARAFHWAIERKGDNFIVVNIGTNDRNYTIRNLAFKVKDILGNVDVEINESSQIDNRSYRVNFDYFAKLAPNFLPIKEMENTIQDLKDGISDLMYLQKDFRNSPLIRLNFLKKLIDEKRLNSNLEWQNA